MEDLPSVRIDAERNRRVLLEAAAGALARDPEASLSEVARLAGLTRATLYRHFGSRDRLLEALRDDALASAVGAVAAARVEEGAALEALRRVITAIASLGGRFWPLLMEADRDPEFVRSRAQAFAPVLAIIERGQVSGQIRTDISPEWTVTALTALLAAAVRQAKGVADPGIADRVFDTVVFGIQGPQPRN
ncbi:MAG: helix-turn-helix domain-containing protein [Micrococcales bacterium]|nr:helix-turn-helix domain-containing protein [Micrococcales bacterium]